jgi:hypothetical protein
MSGKSGERLMSTRKVWELDDDTFINYLEVFLSDLLVRIKERKQEFTAKCNDQSLTKDVIENWVNK